MDETVTPDAPEAPEVDVDAELPEGETFERAYVEKLRAEAAARRVEAKQFKERYQPFESYSEDDRAVWVQLATLLQQDPDAGAKALIEVGQALIGTPQEENKPVDTAPDAPAADAGPLTPEKVQELITAALTADREERGKVDADRQRQSEVVAKGEAHGFKQGSPEYVMWLNAAANETNGDTDKAADVVKAYQQKIIDDYIAGRQGDRAVTPPSGAGAGQKAPEKPKSLDEASAMFRRMIEDQNRGV